MKRILGPVRICGRAWELVLGERAADRRAMAWFGVGPVRSWHPTATRRPWLAYDTPASESTPNGPVCGVCVHAGRWLVLVMSKPDARIRDLTVGTLTAGLLSATSLLEGVIRTTRSPEEEQ